MKNELLFFNYFRQFSDAEEFKRIKINITSKQNTSKQLLIACYYYVNSVCM